MNPFYRTHDMMTFSGVHFRKPFLFIRVADFNMATPVEEEQMAMLTPSLVTGALATGLSSERVASSLGTGHALPRTGYWLHHLVVLEMFLNFSRFCFPICRMKIWIVPTH